MAQSRLNKVASIFTRLNGLLKANIIPWSERPLWYDIYKAFPPTRDPTYRSIAGVHPDDHPALPPKIFYEEDKIRAYYFKELTPIENQVLSSNMRKTIWDIFIDIYNELELKGVDKKNLIQATCDEMLIRGLLVKRNKKSLNESEETKAENDVISFQTKLQNIIKDLDMNKNTNITSESTTTTTNSTQ